jgi:hypothetical protein
MVLSRRRGNGRDILGPLLIGLASLLLLFRKKASTSVPAQVISEQLKKAGLSDRLIRWWIAVSDHETGTWTSRLFREANNMFGMKQPMTRATYSIGPTKSSEGNFATFKSLEDSVKDLYLYMEEWRYPKDFLSIEDFIAFMKYKNYYGDSYDNYLKSVKARL